MLLHLLSVSLAGITFALCVASCGLTFAPSSAFSGLGFRLSSQISCQRVSFALYIYILNCIFLRKFRYKFKLSCKVSRSLESLIANFQPKFQGDMKINNDCLYKNMIVYQEYVFCKLNVFLNNIVLCFNMFIQRLCVNCTFMM